MLRRFADPQALSRAAADLFVQKARASVNARGQFNVALSGGHTPRGTYQLLSQPPWRNRTPWGSIHVFWGDERCVSPDDERSNFGMARQALLDHVPVASNQVHPIRCEKSPVAGAVRYEEVLRNHFYGKMPGMDLIFLGLGQNGHTASLFPHSPVLEEKSRWVAEVHVAEEEMARVTLTPMLINEARVAVFLVFGRIKAPILQAVQEGPVDTRRLPAQLIRPSAGRLVWMVDRAAASGLAGGMSGQEPSAKDK